MLSLWQLLWQIAGPETMLRGAQKPGFTNEGLFVGRLVWQFEYGPHAVVVGKLVKVGR